MTVSISLAQAQEWLRRQLREGAKCPCCTQMAKVYARTITSSSARALIQLYQAGAADDFVHIPTVLNRKQADEAKLRYWGLLEEETTLRPDGGRAGFWRITTRGVNFIHGAAVPKYALVYDGRCLGLEGDPITIRDALGNKFNYAELMAGI